MDEVAWYKDWVTSNPDAFAAQIGLGQRLREKNRVDEAIVCFRQAIRLEPQLAVAHSGLGEALHKDGQLDEAIASLKEAIRLQPDMSERYEYLGQIFREKRALDEAIRCYDDFIQRTPNFYAPYANLSWLLTTWDDPTLRRPAQAVELAQKAIELAPGSDFALVTLATAYYRIGNWGGAHELLNKAMRQGSNSDDVGYTLFLLAIVEWHSEEKDAARTSLARAVEWMEREKMSGDPVLNSLRAEAVELIEPERQEVAPVTGERDSDPSRSRQLTS